MRAWVLRKLKIDRGEGYVTLVMSLYIFGVLTFYYILKPMRAGLFLKNFPADHLPYAYFLTALLAGTIAALVMKLSRRVSVIGFITWTNAGLIASLLAFRWAMSQGFGFLPYAYYVYVQIVSVLSTSQFWLLASHIYESRQAKRIYPLLGAGAILGAMGGSFLIGYKLERIGVDTLMLVCAGICTLLIFLGHAAWRKRKADAGTPAENGEQNPDVRAMLHAITGSRHLSLLIALIFLSLVASQLSEWQVNSALARTYSDLPRELREVRVNALWGQINFWINVVGIVLQMTVTGMVVSRFGIGAAILFMPFALLVASVGIFAVPALWMATLGQGSNSVFRYSINRVGLELLYLPLSPEMRKKVKVFADVFVDRLGRAIAGVIILGLPVGGIRGTAAAMFLITATCILVGLKLRKSYVEAFRLKLARREVDLSEIHRYVSDPATIELLVRTLESAQERQLLYALRLLQSSKGKDFAPRLLPLLRHPSPAVRAEAARALESLPGDASEHAEPLLSDDDPAVRQAALEYLCGPGRPGAADRLNGLLQHSDPRIRLAAFSCMAGVAGAVVQPAASHVREVLADATFDRADAGSVAARLAACLSAGESVPLLRSLLASEDETIVAAALRAAGGSGHAALVFDVLPFLAKRRFRAAARDGLVAFGPRAAGTLGDALSDPNGDPAVRREIPWVLGRLYSPRAADALVDNLTLEDPLLQYLVVKALNRIHARKPEIPGTRPEIARRLYDQTRHYYETLALVESVGDAGRTGTLLGRALRERLDQQLELIFRLLGLQYPQRDIYFAYTALKGGHADRRASAIEFLDNVLSKDLKAMIVPLLEESLASRLLEKVGRQLGIRTRQREDALRALVEGPNPWLRSCALHEIGRSNLRGLADLCRNASRDTNRTVSESGFWALQQFH